MSFDLAFRQFFVVHYRFKEKVLDLNPELGPNNPI